MGASLSHQDPHSQEQQHPAHLHNTGPSPSFRAFRDSYETLQAVQADLRRAGLESSNLIVGIDFTKSNEWTGRMAFGGKCLHHIGLPGELNPYEQAVSIIGQTLSAFDDDGLIPAYGFGCSRTHNTSVFSFLPGDQPCRGFPEVLARYRQLAPSIALAGPTSFAPLIRHAMSVVKASGGQYHILLIIADGQVTRPSDTRDNDLSEDERETIDAIVEACSLPLSIVMVGVGDGPWDVMESFDDRIPARSWDNFQFVPFNDTLRKSTRGIATGSPEALKAAMEATFALHALMEIPEQFREVNRRRLVGPAAASRCRIRPVARLDPVPVAAPQPMPMPMPMMHPQQQAGMYGGAAGGGYGAGGAYGGGGGAGYGGMPPPMAGYGAGGPMMGGPAAAPAGTTWDPVVKQPLPGVAAAAAAAASAAAQGVHGGGGPAAAPARGAGEEEANVCGICMERAKDTAFQCGHRVCSVCAPQLQNCPICRAAVTARIRLY